jgi:hypothetical protein
MTEFLRVKKTSFRISNEMKKRREKEEERRPLIYM